MSHLTITRAGLTSLLTLIVGQLAAFVPAFAPDKQILISAGSAAIATGFLIANAIHKLADSHLTAKDLESGVLELVHKEVANINFTALVHDAIAAKGLPGLEQEIRNEIQRILAAAASHAPAASTTPVGAAPTPAASGPPSTP